jgi:hypothetical protein
LNITLALHALPRGTPAQPLAGDSVWSVELFRYRGAAQMAAHGSSYQTSFASSQKLSAELRLICIWQRYCRFVGNDTTVLTKPARAFIASVTLAHEVFNGLA